MTHAVELTIAYDGSGFHGYQRQPDQRTVDVVIERAVGKLEPSPKLWGASRTDSGVHALGQRCAFDTNRDISALGWLRALNGDLPDDVRVTQVRFRAAGFNPRNHASSKHYRYLVQVGETENPWFRNRVWHVGPRIARPRKRSGRRVLRDWLDLDAMRLAAKCMVGTHDFRAFQSANDFRTQTVRQLTRVEVQENAIADPNSIAIHVEGPAFLKNMVRILVGTLIEVGREQRSVEAIPELFSPNAERHQAGLTAPAHGLTLMSMVLERNIPGTEAPKALRDDIAPT